MSSPLFVLTASSTEASEWNHSIWQQMMSATVPYKFSNTLFNKVSFENESWPDGRAKCVPNGLRMVETLLLREYAEEDVVTCYIDNLEKFVGPETKVLAIHAHNPLCISFGTLMMRGNAGSPATIRLKMSLKTRSISPSIK